MDKNNLNNQLINDIAKIIEDLRTKKEEYELLLKICGNKTEVDMLEFLIEKSRKYISINSPVLMSKKKQGDKLVDINVFIKEINDNITKWEEIKSKLV